ncbi:MAG: hypothetical protein R3301_17650 [Saprospiraceae bacterium]|nr:hypothetical protein [Saprospiraceae bacterium]
MRAASTLFLTIAIVVTCLSHPSYGIVVNQQGEIIFCDVLHHDGTLWKIDRQGQLSKLLTGEHCHFIHQDTEGNIWGTQHEYIPRTDGNRNSLWKYTPAGKQVTVIPPTENPQEFSGQNFVVVGDVVYYNFERKIYRRTPEGKPELLVDRDFGRIMSLQRDGDGNIHVVSNDTHGGSVYRITPERMVSLVAENLLEARPSNPPFEEARFNMLYAAFIRDDGTIFIANSGSRRITSVTPDGQYSHLYFSEEPWYPVAYTEREGRQFVMEYGWSHTNIGPRIVEVTEGEPRVIMDVDNPAHGSQGSVSPLEMDRYRPLKYAGAFGLAFTCLSLVILRRLKE